MNTKNNINRRDFLRRLGIGGAAAGLALAGCRRAAETSGDSTSVKQGKAGGMTYRTNPKTGEKVSILGYGCMRWPTKRWKVRKRR